LPDMAKTFGVEAVDLNIGISAYLITLAVLIPASGWIADRFGAEQSSVLRWLSSPSPPFSAGWPPARHSLWLCVFYKASAAR
jgi:MFS family permease